MYVLYVLYVCMYVCMYDSQALLVYVCVTQLESVDQVEAKALYTKGNNCTAYVCMYVCVSE